MSNQPLDKKTYRLPPSQALGESSSDSEPDLIPKGSENKETSSCSEEVYDRKPTSTDKTVTQSKAFSESSPDSEFEKLTLESASYRRSTDNESGSDSCPPGLKRESSYEFASSSTEVDDNEQITGACSPYPVSEHETSSYTSSDSSIEVPIEEQITEYILQQIMFEEVVKAHRDLKYGTCNKYTIINKQIVRCGHDAYEKVLVRNYLHETNQPILPYIEHTIRLKCFLCKAECSHKTLIKHMRNKCPKRSKLPQVSSESASKGNKKEDSLNWDAASVCDENEDSYEKVYDFRAWRDGSREIERDASPKSPTVQSDSSIEEDSKDCPIIDDISMKLKDLFIKETKIDPACGDNSETLDLVCEAVVSKSPNQATKTLPSKVERQ